MSVLAAASSHTNELEMIGLLLLAFVLSTLIGLERRLRGRNAGLRTQAIVGTSSALFILVSKYGFFDVLGDEVSFDPSRVAAGIVSGIGFLGAGLILSRLLPGGDARVHISVVYDDGHGLLRVILAALTEQGWSVQESGQQADAGEGRTGLQMGLSGRHSPGDLVTVLSGIEGVRSVRVLSEEDDD
jgi:putative Mg2+ transporter-C (MgtC) family protein